MMRNLLYGTNEPKIPCKFVVFGVIALNWNVSR
jgi:hypothetical protein